MKLYKTKQRIAIENEHGFYLWSMRIGTGSVTVKILTSGKVNGYNSFDQSNKVIIKPFNGVKLQANKLSIDLLAKSVVVVRLQ